MKGTRIVFPVAALAVAIVVVAVARAGDPQAGKEMSPEQKAMMEKWAAAATPGEHHAHLAKLVGTWTTRVKFWPAPGAPPEESTGTSTITSIMGGRFIQEKVEGTAMGQPFTGMGIEGYDNITKMHTSIWLDNMGTTIMSSEGTCEAGCSVIKSKVESSDPVSGKKKEVRAVTRIVSDKEFTYEMYDTGRDGKEFKSLEIVYTR